MCKQFCEKNLIEACIGYCIWNVLLWKFRSMLCRICLTFCSCWIYRPDLEVSCKLHTFRMIVPYRTIYRCLETPSLNTSELRSIKWTNKYTWFPSYNRVLAKYISRFIFCTGFVKLWGTNCEFLYCYEKEFMSNLHKSKQFDIIDMLNDTSRYLDDIFTIELSWIGCLTSQLTIFQSYMWRHIDVQADWRRSSPSITLNLRNIFRILVYSTGIQKNLSWTKQIYTSKKKLLF